MLRCKHVGIHLASDARPLLRLASSGCRKYSKVLVEGSEGETQHYTKIYHGRQNTKASAFLSSAIHGTNCASDIRSVIWLASSAEEEEEKQRQLPMKCQTTKAKQFSQRLNLIILHCLSPLVLHFMNQKQTERRRRVDSKSR